MRGSRSGKTGQCQYTTSRSRGKIELVMECSQCGENGLEFIECYSGVLRAIQQHGSPSSIIFRSHVEKRYDHTATSAMSGIAQIANQVQDLSLQLKNDSQRSERCQSCLGPLMAQLEDLDRNIRSRRIDRAIHLLGQLPEHRFKEGVRCHECAGMIGVTLNSILRSADSLEKLIQASTYNTMEGLR